MEENVAEKIMQKLFVGFHLNAELKMHLNESKSWQSAKFSSHNDAEALIETIYDKKEYFGRYLGSEKIALSSLNDIQKQIVDKVASYCPKVDLSRHKIIIFSQIFIS